MILLTGGAGFIGSCFLKILNENGLDDILVVDHFGSSDKWKNLLGKKFYDFLDKQQFHNLIENGKVSKFPFDTIFHFGACTNTLESNADYLIENNYHYSVKLARYSVEKGIRFIYASSAATYGIGSFGYDDDLVFELRPLNPYGFSKYLFDCWVVRNGLDKSFVGLKFFNVFGPNEYHKGEMASMVFKSFNQVKSFGKIRLFKSNDPKFPDGEQKRDFVYVKDVVQIIWKIFNSNVTGIFNIGTGQARSWNELAYAVFRAMGIEPAIEYIDMPKELYDQYQNFTQAKMDKLFSKIGTYEFLSLENAVDDYIKNHLTKDWIYY
jgi:ADP-L-glycero-D-manno-heptose 6-epimerase